MIATLEIGKGNGPSAIDPADFSAVLFDSAPPDGVMVAWFADDARVSTVVGTAPESPVFDLPTHNLRIVDATGRLRPAGPQISRTASLKKRISPKVPSTWSRWSRP